MIYGFRSTTSINLRRNQTETSRVRSGQIRAGNVMMITMLAIAGGHKAPRLILVIVSAESIVMVSGIPTSIGTRAIVPGNREILIERIQSIRIGVRSRLAIKSLLVWNALPHIPKTRAAGGKTTWSVLTT